MHLHPSPTAQIIAALRQLSIPGELNKDAERKLFRVLLSEKIIPARSVLVEDTYGHLVHYFPVELRPIREPTNQYMSLAELLPKLVDAGVSLMLHYDDDDMDFQMSLAFGRLWAQHNYGDAERSLKVEGISSAAHLSQEYNPSVSTVVTYGAFNDQNFPTEIRKAMGAYLNDRYGVQKPSAVIGYSDEQEVPVLIPNIPVEAFPDVESQNEFLKSLCWFLPRRYPVQLIPDAKLQSASVTNQIRPILA